MENNWQYVGAGWFRDKTIPKGKVAPIIHAPELVEQLFSKIEELEKYSRGAELGTAPDC